MPTEEQIRELAYTLWEREGYPEGKHLDHWFAAKQILEEQERARPPLEPTRRPPAPRARRPRKR